MDIVNFYKEAGVHLSPMGSRWKADCPFHSETKSSFVVYPDGSYHCFGCGAHGTAKDIQHLFELDFRIVPDLNTTRDPIIENFFVLKRQFELSFVLLLEDCKDKFSAYDLFDQLMLESLDFSKQVETTLIDLVAFMRTRFDRLAKFVS
jgi:hypothetical protein